MFLSTLNHIPDCPATSSATFINPRKDATRCANNPPSVRYVEPVCCVYTRALNDCTRGRATVSLSTDAPFECDDCRTSGLARAYIRVSPPSTSRIRSSGSAGVQCAFIRHMSLSVPKNFNWRENRQAAGAWNHYLRSNLSLGGPGCQSRRLRSLTN